MIELRHLRYFAAVAEELNFRRASERIHIEQSPLSRAVRDLEEDLGVPLFVRLPRGLKLTPAGLKLLTECRKLLVQLERVKRTVRHTHALYQAPMRVGVADGIAQPRLSECFNRWRLIAPEVPLEIEEMRARELANALRNEEVDVGFSFGVSDDEAIAQTPAWRYRVMALLPRGHELAERFTVPLPELLAFPLLSCNEERLPGLLAQMRLIMHKHIEQATLAGAASTLSGYVTRIAAGAGVGLADAGHTWALQRDDVLAVPLAEEEHITTFVLHKHQRFGIAEPLKRFLAHVSTLS
ncbi:LysR family transcriptional regulator [Xenophilus arseniciresistens]|uniref:LysR family transcriptional regulator n=1 Tax=Xenophilus arseniciresistens TaxID=1283306 RepID=A0AAE3N7L9_9BURK|nr:LysR family transcriptional regulator [Xenophilus arseniciresistens]MDA7417085.1 LysR family transcriptional regulator [Xenophilus arseniciresistens]